VFDSLWGYARSHADAGGYLNHANPEVVMLFSICLAQQQQLQMLRDYIDVDASPDSGGADEGLVDETAGSSGGSHVVQN